MAKPRKWNDDDLRKAVKKSKSIRQVIIYLGLVPAGGNYQQVQMKIQENGLSIKHFSGQAWRKNKTFPFVPKKTLDEILVEDSNFQSYKLKRRLYQAGIKKPSCEMCGWAEQAQDGRIPVELDHINGNRHDNRLSNLRILCPNCHSLQATHRGRNQKRIR